MMELHQTRCYMGSHKLTAEAARHGAALTVATLPMPLVATKFKDEHEDEQQMETDFFGRHRILPFFSLPLEMQKATPRETNNLLVIIQGVVR